MSSKTRKIDYLDEDPIIPSQRFCCFSFLSSKNVKNAKKNAFKFRGAFATEEEAKKHAEEIQQKLDPDFHVFVGEGFKWMEYDPDPDSIETQEYREKALNELMKTHKEQLLLKKQHAEERKKQKIARAYAENEEAKKANKLRTKLQKKQSDKQSKLTSEKEIKEELSKIDDEEKEIEQKQKNFDNETEQLKKMQEAYAKLLESSMKKEK